MIIATAVAFFAMIRDVRQKWPAAVALICAGPMALDMLGTLPHTVAILRVIGLPFFLMSVGTIATVIRAVVILARPVPNPPLPPPVAPARVV
jgi:hypothetical protein